MVEAFDEHDTSEQALLRQLFTGYFAPEIDPRDQRAAFSALRRAFSDGLRIKHMGQQEFKRRVKVALGPWFRRPARRGGCEYCGRPNEGDQCQGCGAWRRVREERPRWSSEPGGLIALVDDGRRA